MTERIDTAAERDWLRNSAVAAHRYRYKDPFSRASIWRRSPGAWNGQHPAGTERLYCERTAEVCHRALDEIDRLRDIMLTIVSRTQKAKRDCESGAPISAYNLASGILGQIGADVVALSGEDEDTPAPGWQPIETAPRDGTTILASGLDHGKGPSRHYSVVEWMDFGCESGWYPDEDSNPLIYLTHWMPLPAPPNEGVEP